MNYIKTPVQKRIHQTAIDKRTTDISKLSSQRIVLHLFKRHQSVIFSVMSGVFFGLMIRGAWL